VLHIDGAIIDGDSSSGGLFGGEASVGSRTIRNALEDIASQGNIKGVVVRIDSPGGSATASEVIWQGIRRVAATKPVWVSVGSMAASGGYYCAVAGDKIYVNPSSIVGSIGVVGGKLSLGGLYEKLKVNVVEHGRGPRAGLFRSTNPWTPDEVALVRAKMQETYDLFTKRVSAGRSRIDLAKTAEGRLFVGPKAVELKMADKVGGLHEAVNDLATSISLADFDVMSYPAPKPIEEAISDMFKGFVRSPGVAASPLSREVDAAGLALFGKSEWSQLKASIEALLLLRKEPVVLVGPRALMFR
jgi:protease IV